MQMNTRLSFYGSSFPLGGHFSRTQRMPRAGIPHHPGRLLLWWVAGQATEHRQQSLISMLTLLSLSDSPSGSTWCHSPGS